MKTVRIFGLAAVLILSMGSAAASQSQPYATLLVTGSIIVNPDGSVARYALDKPKTIPPEAQQEMAKVAAVWRFKPVERAGQPVRFKSYMSVRMVAKPGVKGGYTIAVAGAQFWKSNAHASKRAPGARRTPPEYPRELRRRRVMGTVYLVVEVTPDGSVRRVAAQQVDLGVRASGRAARRWRQALARSSVKAAKSWKFAATQPQQVAADGRRYQRVTVSFTLVDGRGHSLIHSAWKPYFPGPVQFIPWLDPHLANAGPADAIPADGGVYPLRQSLHLLTPLRGG